MTSLTLTYYAQFRGASGNVITGTDGQTWFAITDMSVDQEATLSIGYGNFGTTPAQAGRRGLGCGVLLN